MAHHSQELPDAMRQESRRLGLGPTGNYPLGKLNETDEGEIMMGVSHTPGKVILNFGKPVAWIGFTAEQASELADSFMEHARQARGITT